MGIAGVSVPEVAEMVDYDAPIFEEFLTEVRDVAKNGRLTIVSEDQVEVDARAQAVCTGADANFLGRGSAATSPQGRDQARLGAVFLVAPLRASPTSGDTGQPAPGRACSVPAAHIGAVAPRT